ncbi:hydroxyphenylacetyl-CoA thioesterase PaaI [Microbacterium sp. YY-03]|uniref:hydroxyphenylacetyl-CoA thioesterase PaaI n=1 Tax=Microbacterium sp. YY-03 TaxID=3421636 RepID=UPI003D1718AB
MTNAERLMRDDYASQALGIEIINAEPGDVTLRMTVRRDMLNGFGITHGGMIFSLADTAFAFACNETDTATVAAGADIAVLAPTREGDTLTAHAKRVSRTGRNGIYDIIVTNEVGDTIALFRGRSRTTNLPLD